MRIEAGHAEVLHNAAAVEQIVAEVERVKSVAVARGLAAPENPAETAWLKIKSGCPEMAGAETAIQSAAAQGGVPEGRSSAKNQTEACKNTEFTASQIQ